MTNNGTCSICRLSWLLLALGRLVSVASLELTVGHTWDGALVAHPATLALTSRQTGLLVTVQAK